MKILYQYIIQSQRYYCSEWSYKLRYVLIELFTLVITVLKIGTRRVHVSAKKLDSHFVFS